MNILQQFDKFLQRRFPRFYFNLVQRPRINRRFRSESQLAHGISLSNSSHSSILFFTTQKCASRYVGRVLGRLAAAEGMPTIDHDAYQTMVSLPKSERPFSAQGKLSLAFPKVGYFFGPIGTYREIPEIDRFKIVLQLRDPRDVLTSLYFSTAFSHALINEKMIRRREAALKQDIDSYVLEHAEQYRRIYQSYAENLLHRPNVLFLKYAHMVADFNAWLDEAVVFLEFNEHSKLIAQLRNEANFSTAGEDPYSQKRQVTPGDHRRKLQPETIENLNGIFKDVLAVYKFEDPR